MELFFFYFFYETLCSQNDCFMDTLLFSIFLQTGGRCSNGTCTCLAGFNGEACEICSCTNNCHGHGACEESPVVGGEKTKKIVFYIFFYI